MYTQKKTINLTMKALFSYSLIICVCLSLWTEVLFSQSITLTPNQGTPRMMACPYSFNIIVNSSIPNGVADVRLVYPTGLVNNLSFSPGGAYTTDITGFPIINSGFADIRRFSSALAPKNNAIFGTFSFQSLPLVTGIRFDLPFVLNTKTDGNNLPDSNGNDLLQSVSGVQYSLLTGPCVQDVQAPIFTNHQLQNLDGIRVNGVNAYKIRPDSNVRLAVTDQGGPIGYGYDASNNYVPNIADNQFGVDIPTLSISVDGITYTSTSPELTAGPYAITRERKDRNYDITINPVAANFGVEREITVAGNVRDRTNRRGTTNQGTFSYSFNKPRQPIVQAISPVAGATAVNPMIRPIVLRVSDDRAGVNINSIVVTIAGTPYTVNSSGFSYTSGARSTGGDRYDISIIPVTGFQLASTVVVSVNGQDKVGTVITSNNTYSFVTRANCSLYGCGGEPLSLTYNNQTIQYSGTSLIIDGGTVTANGDRLTIVSSPVISGTNTTTVLTQTVIQTVVQYVPINTNSGQIVYINSGETIRYIQGEDRIVVQPGETIIRYINGTPTQTITGGVVIIREPGSIDPGEDRIILQPGEIIIQTGEVIKYVNSGSTDIYLGDDRNNIEVKPTPEPLVCPDPLAPQIISTTQVTRWPMIMGILIGIGGVAFGLRSKKKPQPEDQQWGS